MRATIRPWRAWAAKTATWNGSYGAAERYAYSAAWVLYGVALLLAGIARRGPILCYGSLAVMLLAVAKVFLYDTARLSDLYRVLSFLGLGVPVTEPSLGLLVANGYQYMLSGKFWISLYPGFALLIAIVAINLVGDRLRDVLNPRSGR